LTVELRCLLFVVSYQSFRKWLNIIRKKLPAQTPPGGQVYFLF
jgi:hypothetical protein